MPQQPSGGPSLARFGVFEVDLRSGELRKAGVRIPLQDQPFRILVLLLHRAGEIVSREELRQELWADDTFVDFEHGLNAAVKRLRDALGDSAETPRFIETLPRRGYRFLSPVQPTGTTPALAAPPPATARFRRVPTWLLAGFAVALIGAVAAAWRVWSHPVAAPADVIVLADLDNQTSEPVLTGTLSQALAVKLAESHLLNLVPEQDVQDTLAMMRRRRDEPLTLPLAREVCQRVGADATVSGTIAPVGSSYVISLNAASCSTGDMLSRDQAQASSREAILGTLDGMATRLRRRLGESLPGIAAANTPLERATTSSLDALKAFTEGERRFWTGDQLSAIPFYKRAIELDPDFAMAHAKLGAVYFNVGIPSGVAELTRAFELRKRLTQREQFYVTAHYHRLARGDLESSRPIYEVWKAAYPRDTVPYISLGLLYVRQGHFDRALAEFEAAARVAPSTTSLGNLFEIYLHSGRLADAQHLLDRWEGTVGAPIHYARFLLAVQRRDLPGVDSHAAALQDDPIPVDDVDRERARAAALFGRMRLAHQLFSRAETAHQESDFAQDSAVLKLEEAIWAAEAGDCSDAHDRVAEAESIDRSPLVRGLTAIALAACGDTMRAGELTEGVSRPALLATAASARIDLARGHFAQVIERLEPLRSGDLAGPLGYAYAGQSHGLALAYLRGKAYLGLRKGAEAAAEFQQILDHPGIAAFAPYHALAPLYLARARAMAGDVKGSRAAYEQMLSLWKDADPDIPVLRAARQEYGRLPGS
jgi:DNA-binding winged helix-turn-helix (wHTH) protein/tetratricopeptide (TPR) repeat protein